MSKTKTEKICDNCAFHDDFTWVCFNPDSDYRADITDKDFTCRVFKQKEEGK